MMFGFHWKKEQTCGWRLQWGLLWGCLAICCLSQAIFAQSSQSFSGPSLALGVIRCSATSTIPLIRSEGLSELIGDIVITCQNSAPHTGVAGTGFVDVDITLALNARNANRLNYGNGPDVTDAILVVNEKNCFVPSPVRVIGGCSLSDETVQDPLLARLDRTDTLKLHWREIALPIPGAAIGSFTNPADIVPDCTNQVGVPGGCHPLTSTVRLTNIRVNVADLGGSGGDLAAPYPIRAALSVHSSQANVLLAEDLLDVAFASPGLYAQVLADHDVQLCDESESALDVVITEGFASAFKPTGTANIRTGDPGWLDYFYPYPNFVSDQDYLITGTRLRVSLTNLQGVVSVLAPGSVSCSSSVDEDNFLALRLVSAANSLGSGGEPMAESQEFRRLVATSETTATAVYEVVAANPLKMEQCKIPFRFSRVENSTGDVSARWVKAAVSLAPLGNPTASNLSAAGPRFIETKQNQTPLIFVRGCGTSLLFPFITSRSNFETAIVITNTTLDPFSTARQAGSCSLHFYDSNSPSGAQPLLRNSTVLEAGRQLAFTMSRGNAEFGINPIVDFQGSVVAECDFQHAKGFAFVTEEISGVSTLAQGYLAETINDTNEALETQSVGLTSPE